MKKLIFKGAATALVTPMNDDFSVNYDKLKELTENQILNKIDALVVNGTTGESATLTDLEKEKTVISVIKQSAGRVPVIAGTGSNSTNHALELSLMAQDNNADALLIVTPYYNKTSQNGLIKHYEYIADRVACPIIVYNVPSRTGVDIKPETYKELSKHPNIVAVKEANGNISALAKSISLCGDDLVFYSGNDDQTLPFLSLGAMGVISVSSNAFPTIMHNICKKYFSGALELSRELFLKNIKIFNAIFCDVNPLPIKKVLELLGFNAGPTRPPLFELSNESIALLKDELKELL